MQAHSFITYMYCFLNCFIACNILRIFLLFIQHCTSVQNIILEWTTSLDTSSRTLFVRDKYIVCRDVHVTSNVELRNNVRLLLNVELRNYVISRQIVERRVTSDCYLNIVIASEHTYHNMYNRHPSPPLPPSPTSLSLPHPPSLSPPRPLPTLSPPSLHPLPTLSPLPSLQQIHCPFQPKQSPS